jgi:UDP-N-acetylglucosamine--N-acetylmuramyl-(pentapeptide) pyrophosphoryl-undecaprenol N-acetylglucosamine transferase
MAFSRILLTGGGTSGHVNPAIAIGRALGDAQTTYLFVGVRGRAEGEVVPREGLPIRFVRASAFPGMRPSPAWAPFLFNLCLGTLKAVFIIRAFNPEIIVGTGGFASAPVMLAAGALRRIGLLRARVYVHEQNAAPGRLNLLVGRMADRVFVSFPDALADFPANGVIAGYPVRQRITAGGRTEGGARLDFEVPAGRQVVFAFGGSQGARTINRAIVDALGTLLPYRDRLLIVHGTGLTRGGGGYDPGRETRARLESRYSPDDRRAIDTFYVSRPYFHDIEQVYARAHLVVVRGGAGTLNEVASLGLPAIVVPKVNLPGEHQVMNARALARCGGAVVLYEETRSEMGALVEALDGGRLASTVMSLLDDPARLASMAEAGRRFVRPDVLETIVRVVGGGPAPAGGAVGPQAAPLLGNQALLTKLERSSSMAREAFRIEEVLRSADDRAYYESRAASLLASDAWETRNLGVKLIGLLQARDKLPLILDLLRDRRPAPWYARLAGGDFVQVGFIRRNALTTVARLGVSSPDVEAALESALGDPYYEARAESARAIAALDHAISDAARERLIAALIGRLRDRWLEVAAASAEALGRIGREENALGALVDLQHHRYWMVRAAGLRALRSMVERGQAGSLEKLEREIRGFILTATDFRPEFTIRTSYGQLVAAIAERRRDAS